MPDDALPDYFIRKAAGTGTDWDFWPFKYLNKAMFAFGPRAKQGLTLSIVPFPFIFYFPIKWLLAWKFPMFESAWWYALPILPVPVLRKWRTFPIVLFGLFGKGDVRWESTDGKLSGRSPASRVMLWDTGYTLKETGTPVYLSTIQYWTKWHIALQWPLHLTFHVYFKEPPSYPDRPVDDHKMIGHRQGARRDADIVYWWWSLFLGLTFN